MPAFYQPLAVLPMLAALVLSPSLAIAQTDVATAKAEYRKAYDAMAQKDWATARELLLGMWSRNKTYDVASSLGQVEFQLQNYAAAARYMTFANANVPPSEKTEFIKKLEKGLREVRGRVGIVRITVNEPGAELSSAGVVLGQSPLTEEIFLDPGNHVIVATKDGRVAQRQVTAQRGESIEVSLTLPPEEPASGLPPAPSPNAGAVSTSPPASSAAAPSSPDVLPAAIGGGLALAAVATGVGFRLSAASSYDDADALRRKNGPQGCANGTAAPADCAAQREANETGDKRVNMSTIAFGVAGAALVGTAVYWFWPRQSESESASPRVHGSIGQHGGFLSLSGNF